MTSRMLFLAGMLVYMAGSALSQEDFVIHPGDTLVVRVWRQPDLSGPVIVRDTGDVHLPLLGYVTVAGYTTTDIAKYCEKRWAAIGVRSPEVMVLLQKRGKSKSRPASKFQLASD